MSTVVGRSVSAAQRLTSSTLHLPTSTQAWAILAMTNDGLVGLRRVSGVEGVEVVPDLAVSLPSPTDDGRTYTFRLRPGIRYSTGRLVEPADIRRALERVFELRPPSPGRQYYDAILGARRCQPGRRCDLARGIVTDDAARTVTFHLVAPDADFLTKLAMPWADAVPSSTPARDIGTQPLPATGPYVVASYRKGSSVRLVRNPKFREWSADAQPDGYPDVLSWTFRTTPDSLSGVRAVQRGAADVAVDLVLPPLSKQELAALAARYPSQLHLTATAATNYFFLNTRVPPFDDVRARRAVNYAFDQRALARRLGLGFAPTCQILPPNYPGYRRTCLYGSGAQRARSGRAGWCGARGRPGLGSPCGNRLRGRTPVVTWSRS